MRGTGGREGEGVERAGRAGPGREGRRRALPQRASTISSIVCAFGHLRLISIARIPKRSTWMVAPAAYQKGPEMPKFHATFDDWRRVAAHVHWETMT